jgi:hypothetical protein
VETFYWFRLSGVTGNIPVKVDAIESVFFQNRKQGLDESFLASLSLRSARGTRKPFVSLCSCVHHSSSADRQPHLETRTGLLEECESPPDDIVCAGHVRKCEVVRVDPSVRNIDMSVSRSDQGLGILACKQSVPLV